MNSGAADGTDDTATRIFSCDGSSCAGGTAFTSSTVPLTHNTDNNVLGTGFEGAYTCGVAAPPPPPPSGLMITEIHYNPCGTQGGDDEFEFVEIFNAGSADINLAGVRAKPNAAALSPCR